VPVSNEQTANVKRQLHSSSLGAITHLLPFTFAATPWHKNYCISPLFILKPTSMEPIRKDGTSQNLEENKGILSSDYERVNNEDEMDTREISHDIEEGDEDYDDEELTEDDFEVDEDEEEDEDGII
jgi:hypothetical protein